MDLLNRVTLLNIDTETVKEILTTYGEHMEVLKKEFIRVNENFQSGKDHLATELLSHSTGRLHVMISGLISVGSVEVQAKAPVCALNTNVTVAFRTLAFAPEALKVATNVQVDAGAVPPAVAEMLLTYLPTETAPVGIAQPLVESLDIASAIGVFRPSSRTKASVACALAV